MNSQLPVRGFVRSFVNPTSEAAFFGNSAGGQAGGHVPTSWNPLIEAFEDQVQVDISLEVPGVSKEDIAVFYHDGVLSIKGEKKTYSNSEKKKVLVKERYYGSFIRTVIISSPVKVSEIKAQCVNGVLHITLPKVAGDNPRQIPVG
jgi:HSP20 family protein